MVNRKLPSAIHFWEIALVKLVDSRQHLMFIIIYFWIISKLGQKNLSVRRMNLVNGSIFTLVIELLCDDKLFH